MSEHKHNPVVQWVKDHPGFAKLSQREIRKMKEEAHEKALEEYFAAHPKKGPKNGR